MAVGLEKEKVQVSKDFLEDMNQMLNLAKDSIKRAQDRQELMQTLIIES